MSIGAVEVSHPTSVSNERRSEGHGLTPGVYTGVAVDVRGRILGEVRVRVDVSIGVEHLATLPAGPWWLVVEMERRLATVPMFGPTTLR